MLLTTALATLLLHQGVPDRSRFELYSPLPTLPAVKIDAYGNGVGLAHQMARAQHLQARILWIDATANIDRYNTEEKIVALVRQIADVGFNTIVFDIKPISGQVVYQSSFAPKIEEWRGKRLPRDFDPVPPMVREAKKHKLGIYVSLNAFSEGHRLFKVGPGYERIDQQTVLYDIKPIVKGPFGESFPLAAKTDEVADQGVSVFTISEKVPQAPAAFAVTVDKRLRVIDGFAAGGVGPGVPTIPRGGAALYGTGEAAEFLRRNALPGAVLSFDSEPLFVPMVEREGQYPLMMNPNHPEVRKYAFNIVEEITAKYDIDGVIYDDRLRYAGINADFSEITRRKFEKLVGKQLNWPSDVFEFTVNPHLTRGIKPGPYYDAWMAFRAGVLKDFVSEVRRRIRTIRPSAQLGVYAGSWYGEYPAIGSNWASPQAEAGFWFLDPYYQQTGFAKEIDFFISGCYYPTATIYEAMTQGRSIGPTVEAAGMLTNRMVRDATWSYAGIMLSDFKNDPEGLHNALQAACASTQGVMVFDLSHDIEPMWPEFRQAFLQPRTAPHERPQLLEEIRQRRSKLDGMGAKKPPVIIAAGSSGAGQ